MPGNLGQPPGCAALRPTAPLRPCASRNPGRPPGSGLLPAPVPNRTLYVRNICFISTFGHPEYSARSHCQVSDERIIYAYSGRCEAAKYRCSKHIILRRIFRQRACTLGEIVAVMPARSLRPRLQGVNQRLPDGVSEPRGHSDPATRLATPLLLSWSAERFGGRLLLVRQTARPQRPRAAPELPASGPASRLRPGSVAPVTCSRATVWLPSTSAGNQQPDHHLLEQLASF